MVLGRRGLDAHFSAGHNIISVGGTARCHTLRQVTSTESYRTVSIAVEGQYRTLAVVGTDNGIVSGHGKGIADDSCAIAGTIGVEKQTLGGAVGVAKCKIDNVGVAGKEHIAILQTIIVGVCGDSADIVHGGGASHSQCRHIVTSGDRTYQLALMSITKCLGIIRVGNGITSTAITAVTSDSGTPAGSHRRSKINRVEETVSDDGFRLISLTPSYQTTAVDSIVGSV